MPFPLPFLLRPAAGPSRFALRSFARSLPAQSDVSPGVPATVGSLNPKRPIGPFRGGLLGFLFGFSVASALASYHLWEEYKAASSLLLVSVQELEGAVAKMSNHVARIESVEQRLEAVRAESAAKADVGKVRGEMKEVFDGLRLEVLDIKSHLWGVEQDLTTLSKRTSVRLV